LKIKVVPAVGGGSPLELDVAALKDTDNLSSLGVAEGDKLVLITRTVGG